jgi:hypothetical protein
MEATVFIQIIEGKCSRQDELRAMADSWQREQAPHAPGWLGATYGFTDDGTAVAVVRFASREDAEANAARPEQGEWWSRMEALYDGPVEFHDCDDVTLMMQGGSDDAGFVQVMQGRVQDPERLKAMVTDTDMLHEARPEIIGATLAISDDGTFTQTIAFSDEAAAREGERKEMPADMRAEFESMMKDVAYLDLHHPWFASAG